MHKKSLGALVTGLPSHQILQTMMSSEMESY